MKHRWQRSRVMFGHKVVIGDGQFYPANISKWSLWWADQSDSFKTKTKILGTHSPKHPPTNEYEAQYTTIS